jgi:hypothetical protein
VLCVCVFFGNSLFQDGGRGRVGARSREGVMTLGFA